MSSVGLEEKFAGSAGARTRRIAKPRFPEKVWESVSCWLDVQGI